MNPERPDLELVIGGRPARFPAVWLRDNCPCPECLAPGTGYRSPVCGGVSGGCAAGYGSGLCGPVFDVGACDGGPVCSGGAKGAGETGAGETGAEAAGKSGAGETGAVAAVAFWANKAGAAGWGGCLSRNCRRASQASALGLSLWPQLSSWKNCFGRRTSRP